jgi:hypothetical protein
MGFSLSGLFKRGSGAGEEIAIHLGEGAIIILGNNYIILVQFLICQIE